MLKSKRFGYCVCSIFKSNPIFFSGISFSQEFAEDQEIIARSVDDFLNFLLIYKEYDAFLIYDRETDISTLKGQLVVLESKGFSNGLVRDLIKL